MDKFYSILVGKKLKILVFKYLIHSSFKDSLIVGYVTGKHLFQAC